MKLRQKDNAAISPTPEPSAAATIPGESLTKKLNSEELALLKMADGYSFDCIKGPNGTFVDVSSFDDCNPENEGFSFGVALCLDLNNDLHVLMAVLVNSKTGDIKIPTVGSVNAEQDRRHVARQLFGEVLPTLRAAFEPIETHLDKSDLTLIKSAMAEILPPGQIFTCAIDKGGGRLVCEVDYDSEFCPEGYDFEKGTEEDWVRISVLHPSYLLYMANFWVHMEDGLLNIDEELEADIFQDPAFITERLVAFLNAVLMPAIKSRVDAGKNPIPFRHARASQPKPIGELE
jgi:hypothetical protein